MTPAASGGSEREVIWAGVFCYLIWGAMPILFIVMGRAGATPWEILGQRAMWSAPWAAALVMLAGQWDQVIAALRNPRTLGLLAASASFIAAGWALYIWSVMNGRNLEASLGYYVTPLLNMAAGAAFYRERIDRFGVLAVVLAAVGVALQAFALGHLPVISLFLATTFWVYGLIRRQVVTDAQAGLFVECLLIAVPGIVYVAWLAHAGGGVFGRSLGVSALLACAGPATVAPLALFAWTARRLPFATTGFLQFIGPTIGFAVGLWMGESLPALRLVSFAFIWAGVIVYMAGGARAAMRLQKAA